MERTNKYHRTIHNLAIADQATSSCTVDVYSVIDAFDVKCPARQHAIKKLLCAGLRGKNDELQDLRETMQAVERAIQLAEQRKAAEVKLHPIKIQQQPGTDGLVKRDLLHRAAEIIREEFASGVYSGWHADVSSELWEIHQKSPLPTRFSVDGIAYQTQETGGGLQVNQSAKADAFVCGP